MQHKDLWCHYYLTSYFILYIMSLTVIPSTSTVPTWSSSPVSESIPTSTETSPTTTPVSHSYPSSPAWSSSPSVTTVVSSSCECRIPHFILDTYYILGNISLPSSSLHDILDSFLWLSLQVQRLMIWTYFLFKIVYIFKT